MPEPAPLRLHDEDPALFREAVRFTAAQTGFVPRLIEKDYFCTVVLEYLSPSAAELVFRGGTCLAKIHAEFYRLSEDLDFVIPTPLDASRSDRSRLAARPKRAVGTIGRQVPGLRVITALTGANDSSQYAAVLGYTSVLSTRGQDWVSRARAMRRMVSEKRNCYAALRRNRGFRSGGFDSPRLHLCSRHRHPDRAQDGLLDLDHASRREVTAQRSWDEAIAAQRRDLLALCHRRSGPSRPPGRAVSRGWAPHTARWTVEPRSQRSRVDCGCWETRRVPAAACRLPRRESEPSTDGRAGDASPERSLVPPAPHHLIPEGRPAFVLAPLGCAQRAVVALDRLIQFDLPAPPYPGCQGVLEDLTPGHPTSQTIGLSQQRPVHADGHLRLRRHGMTVYRTVHPLTTSSSQRARPVRIPLSAAAHRWSRSDSGYSDLRALTDTRSRSRHRQAESHSRGRGFDSPRLPLSAR